MLMMLMMMLMTMTMLMVVRVVLVVVFCGHEGVDERGVLLDDVGMSKVVCSDDGGVCEVLEEAVRLVPRRERPPPSRRTRVHQRPHLPPMHTHSVTQCHTSTKSIRVRAMHAMMR